MDVSATFVATMQRRTPSPPLRNTRTCAKAAAGSQPVLAQPNHHHHQPCAQQGPTRQRATQAPQHSAGPSRCCCALRRARPCQARPALHVQRMHAPRPRTRLQLRGQGRVQRQKQQRPAGAFGQRGHGLVQLANGLVHLRLAREEHEDVPCRQGAAAAGTRDRRGSGTGQSLLPRAYCLLPITHSRAACLRPPGPCPPLPRTGWLPQVHLQHDIHCRVHVVALVVLH